jgi:hypothetical protein
MRRSLLLFPLVLLSIAKKREGNLKVNLGRNHHQLELYGIGNSDSWKLYQFYPGHIEATKLLDDCLQKSVRKLLKLLETAQQHPNAR